MIVPRRIAECKGWLLWKAVRSGGKVIKIPYYVNGRTRGTNGTEADREQLVTFEIAMKSLSRGGYAGLAFAPLAMFGVTALDFDNCVAPNGKVDAEVQDAVDGTYAELSPSGRGIRAFVLGDLGSHKAHAGEWPFGLETFCGNGLVTVTGATIDDEQLDIAEPNAELLAMLEERFGSARPAGGGVDVDWYTPDPVGDVDTDGVKQILSQLSPDDYWAWLQTGMALHHQYGGSDEGLELWDTWSRQSDKYKGDKETRYKWSTFHNSSNPITLRSLLKEAKPQPKPKPTPQPTEEYEDFPLHTLPESVQRFVREHSEAMNADPVMIAAPLLGCMFGAVGNARTARVKAGWEQPSVGWFAVVGESGTMKSPAMRPAVRALVDLQQQAAVDFSVENAEYQEVYRRWDAQSKKLRPAPPVAPTMQRFVVDDVTMESLSRILNENPNGVVAVLDELQALVRGMDAYRQGRGSDVAKWLTMYDAGMMIVDRKHQQEPIIIPRGAVSIVGSTQPGIMRRMISGEHMENGFAARLLVAMPPRVARRFVDYEVPSSVNDSISKLMTRLVALRENPRVVDLSPDAVEMFRDCVNQRGQVGMNYTGLNASIWSKADSYAVRFALLFASAESYMDIEQHHMCAGIDLSDWWAKETMRVYATLAGEGERTLMDVLAEHGPLSVRDIMRRKRFSSADECRKALVALGDKVEVVHSGRKETYKVRE